MTAPRVAVAIDVAPSEVDLVSDQLFLAGASAVSEIDGPRAGLVTLVADLEASVITDTNDSAATLDQDAIARDDWPRSGSDPHEPQVRSASLDWSRIRQLEPEAAWNSGWREFAQVNRCGERVLLRPNWVDLDPIDADGVRTGELVEVVLEPLNAFGSGSHLSTRLCVEALDRLVASGDRVLDFGCGSGVLGVTALLLGAASVTAIDIDAEAVDATTATARLNGVSERLEVSTDSLAEVSGDFDLVCANVLAPVIEKFGHQLVSSLAPGGYLVVSGILADQRARVEAALHGATVVSSDERDGWLLLVLQAKQTRGSAVATRS